ncbi:MAG: WYL domain-containing protein [Verrucomicrobiales bacterium]|nr:WYL domain-containing protein [Verrucomicrobiales bacterium]
MKRPRRPTTPEDLPSSRPPVERMMRIHALLHAGEFPNAPSLSSALEVCVKTVRRDLQFMRDRMGLPIDFDTERNGYFYTEEVDAFPSLQISEGELFALMVAEKALQQYRGTPFEERLVTALKKLERALPDTISLNLAEWDHAISFRTSAEPIVNLPVMETLASAIQRRQQLRLTYRKPGARSPEERVVDPHHLANVNGDWYLFAFDHLRHALRTFVPTRIANVEPTGKSFARPARFALEKQLRDSFGIFSTDGEYEVALRFDESVADYIREKRWHPSQRLTELDGGEVELHLKLGSLVEVQRWILGWGGHAQVLAPRELVESTALAARQLLDRHAPTSAT